MKSKTQQHNKILESSLTDLISKFSKDDVISQMEKEYSSARTKNIPINLVKDNHFLRNVKIPEEIILRLSKNIKENGFYTPLLVREVNGKYELVLGRKRFLAAKMASFDEIPCVIGDFREEEILLILLADARDQRESNVIEIAFLCRELSKRFHYTQQTLGEVSHQSRPQITNIMRLLTLPESVVVDIEIGKLSYGHAKSLVTLNEEQILNIVPRIYNEKLSVRDVENIVKNLRQKGSDDSLNIAKQYNSKRVDIRKRSVTFNFNTQDEVNQFIEQIKRK